MYGAAAGDIVGSIYEIENLRSKDFPLFSAGSHFTDDTVLTAATEEAILRWDEGDGELETLAVEELLHFFNAHPDAAYGGRFIEWARGPEQKPYGSFGNGSAMRISGAGFYAKTLEEAQQLAERVTAVTHNHPDGIRGAAAVASAILLAKTGTPKEEIRRYIDNNYYPVMFTLASIPKDYGFEAACSRSVPQALVAFFESDGFEDAIRNAISIGGDSDTIAAITGSVAEAAYGVPETIRSEVDRRLTPDIRAVFAAFGKKLDSRK